MSDPRDELETLLAQLLESPDAEDEIEQKIRERFEETRAVLALDLCGFSKTTQERGIVAFLAAIHLMRRVARPIVESRNGFVVDAVADNILYVFEQVEDAVAAGRELIEELTIDEGSADIELHASVGIGYGPILNFGNLRVAGDEVNIASKVGEDIAQADEILLTAAARETLDGGTFEERRVTVSGLELACYRVEA